MVFIGQDCEVLVGLEMNKILGSTIRRKILEALSGNEELAIMKLVQLVNSTHNEVDRNLRILENERLIIQYRLGTKRIIRLNRSSEKTLILLETLTTLKNASRRIRITARTEIY